MCLSQKEQTLCLLFFKMDRQYNNTIKVQRVFSFDACRIQFIARSLKYARYVFNQAPRGHQWALKQKSPTAEKRNFPVLQGGRTQEYRAYFKDDSAVKPNNAPSRRRIVL